MFRRPERLRLGVLPMISKLTADVASHWVHLRFISRAC